MGLERKETIPKNYWGFMTTVRESGTVAISSKTGVPRREVGSPYELSMTSQGSSLVHRLYFSWRHLQPASERPSKDSQPCPSAASGRSQHPQAQRQSSHTSSSCAWSNTSVGFSLWSHSFSHPLCTVCLYTTIYTQGDTITFVPAAYPIPCAGMGQRWHSCFDKGVRGDTWAQCGEGALGHCEQPGWNPGCLNPRTAVYLQHSCFLPWSAPSWAPSTSPDLTPHPLPANSSSGGSLSPVALPPTGDGGTSGPPPSSRKPGTHAPGLTSFPLPSCLQTLPQPAVQGQELPQEAPVGDDASVVLDFLDGLHEGQVVVQHEVGQDQCGGPAHAHGTVHQDPPCEDRHTRQLWGCWWGVEKARERAAGTGEEEDR